MYPTYSADEPVIDLDAVRAKNLSCDPEAATLDVADLTTLHVGIAELRVAPDGKWLYVLQVTCGRVRWRVQRRYSEIREFWQTLRELLVTNEATCTERCHFLAGLEGDKFPKKHLLHTKTKLEERANELETFFVKLVLRLNLCSRVQMERCYLQKCSLLTLLTNFFEIGAQYATAKRSDPYACLTSYQSIPRIENNEPRNSQQQQLRHSTSRIGGGKKKKADRRFSFGALRDVRVSVEPQD